MKHRRHRPSMLDNLDIDLAPMIDCIFILLIFFILTSVFVEDPGIEVDRPNVSGSDVADRNAVLIAITADNRIYFEGREVRQDQVAQMLKQSVYDPDSPLIIRADRNCNHGTFATVYSEAKKAGLKHVKFAIESQRSL